MKKQNGIAVKLIFIGIIVGILLLLNLFIGSKRTDREHVHDQAVRDINYAAGGKFYISDVYIGIPYVYEKTIKNDKGVDQKIVTDGIEFFQPDSVDYNADFKTNMRKIGIYSSPVFTADLKINAAFNFNKPVNTTNCTYKPENAFIRIKLNDKSIMSQPEFIINGKSYKSTFAGSTEDKQGLTSYFNCTTGKIDFSTDISIRGADEFYIKLSSQASTLNVTSDWNSPGFKNFTYLPSSYDISETGFTANWNVPFDSGNCENTIGFTYVNPVNIYKMINRAITYGFLFIVVPFIVLFLFEIFLSINLHPLNYLLCGAASIIFFLMLLSISEHIPFFAAYIISAASSGLLISLYVASISKKPKTGFTMIIVFSVMYSFLYLSLRSEDYALLIGTLFTFIVLAAIMFLTRNVNWSNLKKSKTPEEETLKQVEATNIRQ